MGTMNDYPADLPNRVMRAGGPTGPLTNPIQRPSNDNKSAQEALNLLNQQVKSLPADLALMWRKTFVVPSREQIPLLVTAAPTQVTANKVTVVTTTIDQKFGGFLTHVGVSATPGGVMSSLQWSLEFDGQPHAKFTNLVFNANYLSPPLPWQIELISGKKVSLVVTQPGGTVPVDVCGILIGWTEYLSTYKPYGLKAASGSM